MPNCINHTTRRALYECRRCSQPICDQCSAQFQRFCGDVCKQEFQSVAGRISDRPVGRRTRFSAMGCLRTLIISAVLLVVIYGAVIALFGSADPAVIGPELRRMLRVLF